MFLNLTKNKKTIIFSEKADSVHIYKKKDDQPYSWIGTFRHTDVDKELPQLISNFPEIQKNNIVWILDNNQYDIINVEKTLLNKEETTAYIKWKIKDIVGHPSQDVVYDILFYDKREHSFFKKHLTIISSLKTVIERITDIDKKFKLHLTAIDIPELTLRNYLHKNLTTLNGAYSCLQILENKTIFIIYFDDAIILKRVIERGTSSPEYKTDKFSDRLILEVQRGMDFVDRQYSISLFKLFSVIGEPSDILNKIKKNIETNFNMTQLEITDPHPEIVGAFLRENI